MHHLDAAYNLARWLTHNVHDAEDVVQESYLRAFRFFGGFRGGDSRAWLLTIVRNTAYTWLQRNRSREFAASLDEELQIADEETPSPEAKLLSGAESEMVRQALEALPLQYREVMVLRELEELSYKEISHIADIPIGTVMSRLARARKRLQQSLAQTLGKEV